MYHYISLCPVCGAIHRIELHGSCPELLFSLCVDKCGSVLFSRNGGELEVITSQHWKAAAAYLGYQVNQEPAVVEVLRPVPVPMASLSNADFYFAGRFFHLGEISFRSLAKLRISNGHDQAGDPDQTILAFLEEALPAAERTVDTKRLRDLLGEPDFQRLQEKYPGVF